MAYFISIFFALSLVCGNLFAANYSAKVYHEVGGSRAVVASGGSFDVESGGEIDIESGGSLKLAGTAVTSTAAELNSLDADSLASDGLLPLKVARATLDCGATTCSAGSHGLGVSLPANSLITHSFFYIVTQFVDSGSGTVALQCEDSGNIYAAVDITGSASGTIVAAAQGGSSGAILGGIAASCELTAVVASATQTAGKLNLFVVYTVAE